MSQKINTYQIVIALNPSIFVRGRENAATDKKSTAFRITFCSDTHNIEVNSLLQDLLFLAIDGENCSSQNSFTVFLKYCATRFLQLNFHFAFILLYFRFSFRALSFLYYYLVFFTSKQLMSQPFQTIAKFYKASIKKTLSEITLFVL